MDWLAFGGKLVGTIVLKMALNTAVPGSGAAVDFAQAGYDLYQGDVTGCLLNLASGVGEVCTLGASGCVKDAMKGSAKKGGVQTAKEVAKIAEKKATKQVGQEFGKQLAKGMIEEGGKETAIKTAKATAYEAGKKATKNVGQLFSKEIAGGVFNEAVEEAWKKGTKMTTKLGHSISMKLISTGGHEIFETVAKDFSHDVTKASLEAFLEMTKQAKKGTVFVLTQSATAAASKEFTKNAWKLTGIDYAVALVKGGINYSRKESQDS